MNIAAAVVTTFPNSSWKIYSQAMLSSFVKFWPSEIPILIQLDDDLLEQDVKKIIRPQDGCITGWTNEHNEFVVRNKDKDDPQDYRKQAVRFCHKVFALKFALDSTMQARNAKATDAPRYLIWMDADVLTTAQVSFDSLIKCFPKDGDAASYMGRKDWDHSECGWLVFDLENDGGAIIEDMFISYKNDDIFKYAQWHDSYVFDVSLQRGPRKATNLTPDATGMEVWPQSPMASWSKHYKGPIAKAELAGQKVERADKQMPLRIQTKNSLPDESIQQNIIENQAQITNWVKTCSFTDEEIVVVSAGPQLIAEDLLDEVKAGRKIVAVKHALEPLKKAGIKPWACILLDPRDHVANFVENPDKDIIWFVASQVTPKAVRSLLDADCEVWGYHAAVGANESRLIERQSQAIVQGGSATATRGLYLLDKLGFQNFRLYGYDLCFSDKPDLNTKDDIGQPKYFEVSICAEKEHFKAKKAFWSDGQLLAQYQEFADLMGKMPWRIRAFGHGIVPFLTEADRVSNLRQRVKESKLGYSKPASYRKMLGCRKTKFSTRWRSMLPKIRQVLRLDSNS